MRNECLGKVTEYELSVLRRLAMAQEKPEGGLKAPPHGIGLTEAVFLGLSLHATYAAYSRLVKSGPFDFRFG